MPRMDMRADLYPALEPYDQGMLTFREVIAKLVVQGGLAGTKPAGRGALGSWLTTSAEALDS